MGCGEGTGIALKREGQGKAGLAEGTHAGLRTLLGTAARRGAVPVRTARGRCAGGTGAHRRPLRRAARSARGRRNVAPKRLLAARRGPTGPQPPGVCVPPRVLAGSRRALRREGRMLGLRASPPWEFLVLQSRRTESLLSKPAWPVPSPMHPGTCMSR